MEVRQRSVQQHGNSTSTKKIVEYVMNYKTQDTLWPVGNHSPSFDKKKRLFRLKNEDLHASAFPNPGVYLGRGVFTLMLLRDRTPNSQWCKDYYTNKPAESAVTIKPSNFSANKNRAGTFLGTTKSKCQSLDC